jgi:hypothetical protein
LTPENVTSLWQKSGILREELGNGSVDREVVLSQLPPEVEGPQSRPSTAHGPVDPHQLNRMPGTVAEVQAVMQRVKNKELSDIDTLLAIEKLGKAAANAIAESKVTRSVNQDLVDATKKKEQRKKQNQEDGIDGSHARVMGRNELLRRREFAAKKKFEAACKEFFQTGFAEVFSCNITAKYKGINPQSSSKMFDAAWKEFSHASFAVVFSCNITAKDKGIKPRSFTKPPTKPPAKSSTKSPTDPQLPLPLFTDLILPSLSNTAPISNSGDHIRKSPKIIVKKIAKTRALKAPPKAKKPASKAPRKTVVKVAANASSESHHELNQAETETQVKAPITTRSGRTVKRKIWE